MMRDEALTPGDDTGLPGPAICLALLAVLTMAFAGVLASAWVVLLRPLLVKYGFYL